MNEHQSELAALNRRMDTQDALLRQISDSLVAHVAIDAQVRPALEELAVIWKASKIVVPILVGIAAATVAVVSWAKEHIRW